MDLNCIECGDRAEYIMFVGGTGGSLCLKHKMQYQKHQDAIIEKLDKKIEELDKKIKDGKKD